MLHRKLACKVCPPEVTFSNVLISDAIEPESVAFSRPRATEMLVKCPIMKRLLKGPHSLSTNYSLTSYRPNFCCECGEKIVRLRWRVWTSRRFCDKCCPRFRKMHLLQRAFAIAAL